MTDTKTPGDRELLEMAAKASGYRAVFNLVDACQLWTDDLNSDYIRFWNPLTDDGDALRLAVKLELSVDCSLGVMVQVAGPRGLGLHVPVISGDLYATTRRAVVLAAASIGAAL